MNLQGRTTDEKFYQLIEWFKESGFEVSIDQESKMQKGATIKLDFIEIFFSSDYNSHLVKSCSNKIAIITVDRNQYEYWTKPLISLSLPESLDQFKIVKRLIGIYNKVYIAFPEQTITEYPDLLIEDTKLIQI